MPTKKNTKYPSWEYYKTIFKLGNQFFEGKVNIGIDQSGNKHLYEISNIKRASGISETSLNSPTGSSANNISQNANNVKFDISTKYSIQENQNNTPEQDNSSFSSAKKDYRGSHQIENANKITDLDLNEIKEKVIEANGGTSKLYVNQSEIKVDDKQILKFPEGPYTLAQVSVYNDVIITLQTESLYSSIIIYDFSGKTIKSIDLFNDEQGRTFRIFQSYSQDERFNVSTDGIISFAGTKHIQGAANTYIDNSGATIDLCTQGENINENEIVSGIFKMTYLGNYSFSDITYVSTKTTVKDIKSCN